MSTLIIPMILTTVLSLCWITGCLALELPELIRIPFDDVQTVSGRTIPSPLGNINQQSLQQIYTGGVAQAYRRGCRECDSCRLRATCGVCLAVAHGYGLDPLEEKDPACFIEDLDS